MKQVLKIEKPYEKRLARKLSDGSEVEVIVSKKWTIVRYRGNLFLALREMLPKKLHLACAILNSSKKVLSKAGCSRTLAMKIKRAIYDSDETAFQYLLAELLERNEANG